MKKMTWIFIMILIVGLLVGCSSNEQGAADQGTDTGTGDQSVSQAGEKNQDQLRTDFADNALSEEMQLVVGSFLLEDTDLVISADQAGELIPYWKLYLNMQGSDTTTSEEFAGLIAGIQQTMSSEQISYIASLQLTQEDVFSVMTEFGIMENMGQRGGEDGDVERPSMPEGGMPGGGPGGGDGSGQRPEGAGPGGEGMDPMAGSDSGDSEVEAGARPGGMGSNRNLTPFITALIELLESKIES